MAFDNLVLKAISYEVLSSFFKNDVKAWEEFEKIRNDDLNYFVSFSSRFTKSEEEKRRFEDIWRNVRDSFSSLKINYDILIKGEENFPKNIDGDTKVLYSAGKKVLMEGKKIAIFGRRDPSLSAKDDARKIVDQSISLGYTILSPLERGLNLYILSYALENGGNVIGVLSNSLNKCPFTEAEGVMEELYNKGLLLSQFAPSKKREPWHVALRNRFISFFGDAFFLLEEGDGGPEWKIVDEALMNGKRVMTTVSNVNNPNYRWFKNRVDESGMLVYKKKGDLKLLFPNPVTTKRIKKVKEKLPSLFDE